jgi:glycerol-3-phosphate dehydrogenase
VSGSGRDYDLVIIGGGINGAGIARDAALRGLGVLLLEQGDFGSGTTSWPSRLIHGGLRYLEYGELPLVYESLHERRNLLEIAPHLVDRLAISIPVYRYSRRGRWILRLGMLAYDLLSIGKNLPRHRMLSHQAFLDHAPGVNPDGLLGGACYYDAQVTFAERLVIENIVAARRHGADVRNYSPVTGIRVRDRQVESVRYRDLATGVDRTVRAAVVVNAAGPWVDRVLDTADAKLPRLMGGTKGSHVVVGRFEGAPDGAFYVEAAADGRPVFIIPWNGQFLIGTTDIRYDGDPADAVASREEVQYLLSETNRVFPAAGLSFDSLHYAYAGIRPLPRQERGPESAITRRHIIRQHGRDARGLVSVIGGKLTTYRHLSQQVCDQVFRMLGRRAPPCRTGSMPLPGGDGLESAKADVGRMNALSSAGRERLLGIYGGRTRQILDLAASEPGLGRILDDAHSVPAAEIAFCIRNEFARHLVDIMHRRTMLGLAPDLGRSGAAAVVEVAAAELKWDKAEKARQLDALEAYNARLSDVS